MQRLLMTAVSTRGRVTIRKELRAQLGIQPRDRAVQRIEDGKLVVEFVRSEQARRSAPDRDGSPD